MIFIFETRYSGWPIGGTFVACIENPELEWREPYVEELIDDVTGGGDTMADEASEEIRRRCHLAGGDTPGEALENLLQNPKAQRSLSY